METITRDGETWEYLDNADDLIIEVKKGENIVVQYAYDSAGRRVEMMDGMGEKDYVVAPLMGEGLESPHLVMDKANDPLAAYVYAGAMPLMRLDDQGNPTYYLEDGMGSIVGLADNAGVEVAEFEYDSFGNLRNGATGMPNELGGDFRFQGQWLESNTDFYHFRARYYDPETGRFVSRDPIDVIETEPESSNPYQFVYNNPHVYSDPSGLFSVSEIGVTNKIQNILNNLKTSALNGVKDSIINEVKGIATNVIQSAFNQLLPFDAADTLDTIHGHYNSAVSGSSLNWEDMLVENSLCTVLTSMGYPDHVWKDVKIDKDGDPQDDGHPCGTKAPLDLKDSKPDFIIKNGLPTDKSKKAFLIGDVKLTLKNIKSSSNKKGNQFRAIINFADPKNKHQYVPVATYVTIFGHEGNEDKLKKRATKQGVHLFVVDFFPDSRRK